MFIRSPCVEPKTSLRLANINIYIVHIYSLLYIIIVYMLIDEYFRLLIEVNIA